MAVNSHNIAGSFFAMANSLNAKLPVLGRILDEPPDTLRTRQRALVAAGLLDSTPGKGPGSGVAATPRALAQFLIGTCTGPESARDLMRTRAAHGNCPLTGSKTFLDALAAVLTSAESVDRVRTVEIATSWGYATIRFDGAALEEGPDAPNANPFKSSVFVGAPRRDGLMFQTSIPGEILRSIVREVLI